MLDPGRIRALTFDCYGTLIDWDGGIAAAVTPLLERRTPSRYQQGPAAGLDIGIGDRPVVSPSEFLTRWHATYRQHLTPFRPYRELLGMVLARTLGELGLEAFTDDGWALARSIAEWPAFPDASRALRRLARRWTLGLVADADPGTLAASLPRLAAPFALLVTSEEAGAYKPDPAPFRAALGRLGFAPAEVLHVSTSAHADGATARGLGMATAIVHRGDGPAPMADLQAPSLAALADALGVV